jgi:predicted dehydrogenase
MLQASRAGKHVSTQKPMAITAEDADAVVETAGYSQV